MQLAMIGLGKMGGNMVERLMKGGHTCVVYDRNPETVAHYAGTGATAAKDLDDLSAKLTQSPKVAWIMVPAGKPVDDTIATLLKSFKPGDVVIDGGNSNFHDSMARGRALAEKGIEFIDAGTSGGVWGLANGYCLMVGASDKGWKSCEPIFKTLAPENGYIHAGPPGAGHYVKMIHNGIEYGMMQSYAEGYEILHACKHFKLDLPAIAEVWNHSSVVRSWLNELMAIALKADPNLDSLKGWVEDSGEGRWTILESIELDVPAPVLTISLQTRFRSRQPESFSAKIVSALRNQFGGHAVKKA